MTQLDELIQVMKPFMTEDGMVHFMNEIKNDKPNAVVTQLWIDIFNELRDVAPKTMFIWIYWSNKDNGISATRADNLDQLTYTLSNNVYHQVLERLRKGYYSSLEES